jgi:hypothetical protein
MTEQPAARTALLDPHPDGGDVPEAAAPTARWQDVPGWISLLTRFLGALAVLVVGIVHLQAYDGPYSAVPAIGELFILNVVAATVIGVTLLAPIERIAGRRGPVAVTLVTVAGIGLAVVSLAMLIVAERGTLFGFHEPGYDPDAIRRSRVAEVVAACLLTTSLLLRSVAKRRPRW